MKFLRRFLSWIGGGPSDGLQERFVANIDFSKLEEILHCSIHRKQLYSEALSHRSYLQHEGFESSMSNERLEFLGDAVLNLAVAEYVFRSHTDVQEGMLTKLRSRLVNHKALTVYAHQIQLSRFVLMSPSAAQMEGKGMDTILADAFEALLGAIYLDSGYVQAREFVERNVRAALDRNALHIEDKNFKSQLLELVQSEGSPVPRYILIEQRGPDHDRTFTVEVLVGATSYGRGVGKNKKDAEQAAAEQAVQQFQNERHIDIGERDERSQES